MKTLDGMKMVQRNGLVQDLDWRLEDNSEVGFVYKMVQVIPDMYEGEEKKFYEYWGIAVEEVKEESENLDVEATVYRTTGGKYHPGGEEGRVCKTSLRLTWIGSRLTII